MLKVIAPGLNSKKKNGFFRALISIFAFWILEVRDQLLDITRNIFVAVGKSVLSVYICILELSKYERRQMKP